MMLTATPRKLYDQLEPTRRPEPGPSARNLVLVVAILLATTSAILGIEPMVTRGRDGLFRAMEVGFGAFFVTQYAANAQMVRLLRLIRIVRLAKLGRMSAALRHLGEAVLSSRMELALTAGLASG